jgi:DNA (cytosine-5)-methyltransferase 1
MRFGSICSGIEAASAAWLPLGWQCQFMSEIEAFPRAVLSHHYPETPLHGDFTTIRGGDYGPVDVLVGGTPCQSFSVAGLRGGLADARGNLALEYLRLAERLRPRWIVWENVPGVLSSAGGRDFGAFVGGLAECGYGWAYRILDAQYFGLAQRRKRVFVVGCLGDWRGAAAVLFKSACLRGYPAPGRETRERVADSLTVGANQCSGPPGDITDVATTLGSRGTRSHTELDGHGAYISVSMSLNAHAGRLDGESETFIPQQLYSIMPQNSGRDYKARPVDVAQPVMAAGPGMGDQGGDVLVTHSLRADGFDASEDGTGRGTPLVFDQRNNKAGEQVQSLRTGQGTAAPLAFTQNTSAMEGNRHASPSQTNSGTILLRVRKEIGAEAFAEWGLGILHSFHPEKILRPTVHGQEFRQATFSRSWVVCCTLGSPFSRAEGAMRSLREACGERCPSSGWGPLEQRADELGAYLSELSQPGAQAERFLHDLWQSDEGPGLLREALSEVQKTWRSAPDQNQPTQSGSAVRRLTATECEFLQGFPRNYTLIPYRGKLASDGPRYRALGNSMAVPCMAWIGRRIQQVTSSELSVAA